MLLLNYLTHIYYTMQTMEIQMNLKKKIDLFLGLLLVNSVCILVVLENRHKKSPNHFGRRFFVYSHIFVLSQTITSSQIHALSDTSALP